MATLLITISYFYIRKEMKMFSEVPSLLCLSDADLQSMVRVKTTLKHFEGFCPESPWKRQSTFLSAGLCSKFEFQRSQRHSKPKFIRGNYRQSSTRTSRKQNIINHDTFLVLYLKSVYLPSTTQKRTH